jgi:hypothetical protein
MTAHGAKTPKVVQVARLGKTLEPGRSGTEQAAMRVPHYEVSMRRAPAETRKTSHIMKRPLMQADAGGRKSTNFDEVDGELLARGQETGLEWLTNGVGWPRLRPIPPRACAFHVPSLP